MFVCLFVFMISAAAFAEQTKLFANSQDSTMGPSLPKRMKCIVRKIVRFKKTKSHSNIENWIYGHD